MCVCVLYTHIVYIIQYICMYVLCVRMYTVYFFSEAFAEGQVGDIFDGMDLDHSEGVSLQVRVSVSESMLRGLQKPALYSVASPPRTPAPTVIFTPAGLRKGRCRDVKNNRTMLRSSPATSVSSSVCSSEGL
jgi:hypothetical protein